MCAAQRKKRILDARPNQNKIEKRRNKRKRVDSGKRERGRKKEGKRGREVGGEKVREREREREKVGGREGKGWALGWVEVARAAVCSRHFPQELLYTWRCSVSIAPGRRPPCTD